MTRDCPTCSGQGVLAWSRHDGPSECRDTVTCGDCRGKRIVLVRCSICGDAEATREAWVISDPRKPDVAERYQLCCDCLDADETSVVELTTRCLPATEADDIERQELRDATRQRMAQLHRQLLAVQASLARGVGHA